MALFAMIALGDSALTVDQAVSSMFSASSFQIEPGKWIVDADVTIARELSEKLGLKETTPHLTFAVRGYFGRARPDLWEWMAAKSEKK
jgi:hypothetical protein